MRHLPPLRPISDIEAEIGVCFNPADGRSWYRLAGSEFGDFDCTCGHYRSTRPDGTMVVIRDDTMKEALVQALPPNASSLVAGWRWLVEDEDDE